MSELLSNFFWLTNIVVTIGVSFSQMSFVLIQVFAFNMMLLLLLLLIELSFIVMVWRLFNILMEEVIYFLFLLMMLMMFFDLFLDQLCLSKNVVDRCMWLSQDVSVAKMMLQSFDIVRLSRMMFAHIVLKSCSRTNFHIMITTLGSSSNLKALSKGLRVLGQDVETHFKDIVHFELIAEAFFLVVCIDVAQSLASR